jgi:hypothetical protein
MDVNKGLAMGKLVPVLGHTWRISGLCQDKISGIFIFWW